jgi:hypothetical protein
VASAECELIWGFGAEFQAGSKGQEASPLELVIICILTGMISAKI